MIQKCGATPTPPHRDHEGRPPPNLREGRELDPENPQGIPILNHMAEDRPDLSVVMCISYLPPVEGHTDKRIEIGVKRVSPYVQIYPWAAIQFAPLGETHMAPVWTDRDWAGVPSIVQRRLLRWRCVVCRRQCV